MGKWKKSHPWRAFAAAIAAAQNIQLWALALVFIVYVGQQAFIVIALCPVQIFSVATNEANELARARASLGIPMNGISNTVASLPETSKA